MFLSDSIVGSQSDPLLHVTQQAEENARAQAEKSAADAKEAADAYTEKLAAVEASAAAAEEAAHARAVAVANTHAEALQALKVKLETERAEAEKVLSAAHADELADKERQLAQIQAESSSTVQVCSTYLPMALCGCPRGVRSVFVFAISCNCSQHATVLRAGQRFRNFSSNGGDAGRGGTAKEGRG